MLTGNVSQSGSLSGTIQSGATLSGTIRSGVTLSGRMNIPTIISADTEEKTVTPNNTVQEITPSAGRYLSKVTVDKIPNNYGLITYNGLSITVS